MSSNNIAIEIDHVSFSYTTASKERISKYLPINRVRTTTHQALKDVSLSIRKNRITTLLGKNGSGKTTLIRMICGDRVPQSGTVRICGQDPRAMQHKLGLFMGGSLIYHRLTGRENLEYFGRLYGVKNIKQRIEEMSALTGLSKQIDQIVESYSFGMKIKLGLARAMIHTPEILILDEPTLGIDIDLAKQIREFIRNLNCTVLLTTHYMEEAEQLSDDLCVIDKGRLITHGTRSTVCADYKVETIPDAFTAAIQSVAQQPVLSV